MEVDSGRRGAGRPPPPELDTALHAHRRASPVPAAPRFRVRSARDLFPRRAPAPRRVSPVLAVIPARWGASRFPGKPLAPLWGKPLIRHVWERAVTVAGLDRVVVATDDDRIASAARSFGAEVVMTSSDCASGTDRVAEVARQDRRAEVIVNLQGDEPELDADGVSRLVAGLREEPGMPMATLACRERDPAALASEHVVKLEVDAAGFALYFTRRWPPPAAAGGEVLRHVGVYGFARPFLLQFTGWPTGEAERRERLEQLRAVERGVRIRVFPSVRPSAGVDTPEQLAALERRGPG
jgi:3-deoxy-manno-octulosonate cytidylyltransferase (CMP-KDO synthetase)